VWDSMVWVWGSECVLCVGQFGAGLGEWVRVVCGIVWCGFGGVGVCCVWESLVWVWGSECVLCVGQFLDGLWEWVRSVCGRDWSGFGGVGACCVWEQFGVGLGE